MIKLSVLFSVKNFPTETDDYYDDANPNIAGLAEWFINIPDLFLLLLGKDAVATPFASYSEPGTNRALVVETLKAQRRWQMFFAIAKQVAPQLIEQLAHINHLLMAEQYPYLVLDIWGSVSVKDQANKVYNAYVANLIGKAAALEDALLNSTPSNVSALIAAILENSQNQLGYWSTAVVMRSGVIERSDVANIPLLADYQEYSDGNPRWLYHIPAYIVRHKGSPEYSASGVVTPYGRWLVPIELGMNDVDGLYNEQKISCDGWIPCSKHGWGPTSNSEWDSVLFDINGCQVTPVLKNTSLSVHSHKVGSIYKKNRAGELVDIVSLPDLTVLVTDAKGVDYPEDDFLHYRVSKNVNFNGENQDIEFYGLMSREGQIIVPAEQYASIGPVHKTKQIAAVTKLRPDYRYNEQGSELDNISNLRGVIDAKGRELIPCQYAYVLPINGDGYIKVHQKDRLLLMGLDGKLSIFKTTGELVAATNYTISGTLVYLGGYLQKDYVTVTDGENVMTMDFDGIAGAPEMSQTEFMDAALAPLRDGLNSMKLKHKTVSAEDIHNENPWTKLLSLCQCLCFGDEAAAQKIYESLKEHLVSEEYDEEDWSIPVEQPASSVLFNLALHDAIYSGFGATIDWKDSETLGALASMVTIPALHGFYWSASDNGDSMTDGISAAADFVRKNKVNLFTLPATGDMYEIGFVRDIDMQTLMELTSSVGLHLNFDW